jgi:hypothetical protein
VAGGRVIAKLLVILLITVAAYAVEPVTVQTKNATDRERQLKTELEEIIASHDLSKYTFTRTVLVDERAMNYAFPVLTLNTHFRNSDDELLSSFLHEQLHWYLQAHHLQMQDAVAELRRFYPRVPVGLPDGAETAYSTYGHLVDCYLEIQADRQVIGENRTKRVIKNKPRYLWIYKTVTDDEPRIAAIVNGEHLEIK